MDPGYLSGEGELENDAYNDASPVDGQALDAAGTVAAAAGESCMIVGGMGGSRRGASSVRERNLEAAQSANFPP